MQDLGCARCWRRFPSVKHNRAQETEVSRGQWAAVNGDDILLVAAVWTVHSNYLVVCGRRNSKRDADQPASPQQTVRGRPPLNRGKINTMIAVRAVDRPENRIQTLGLNEP